MSECAPTNSYHHLVCSEPLDHSICVPGGRDETFTDFPYASPVPLGSPIPFFCREWSLPTLGPFWAPISFPPLYLLTHNNDVLRFPPPFLVFFRPPLPKAASLCAVAKYVFPASSVGCLFSLVTPVEETSSPVLFSVFLGSFLCRVAGLFRETPLT